MRVYPASAVLAGFAHDGMSLKSYSLEDQEWVFQPLLQIVGMRDLFLRQYFVLCPKCLREAWVEHRGAIVDFLRIVRCRCMVIFRVLG